MEIRIKQCPYCKSNSGFQFENKIHTSYGQWLDFEGENVQSDYGDYSKSFKPSTPTCVDCKKPLGRWIKL